MANWVYLVTLALVALLTADREVPVSGAKLVFSRLPLCEHMAESPDCSRVSNPICGTDGVTYDSECQLCLARIKTKQDIQIVKDDKC